MEHLGQVIIDEELRQKYKSGAVKTVIGFGVAIGGLVVGNSFDYGEVDDTIRFVGYAGSFYAGWNLRDALNYLAIRKGTDDKLGQ